MDGHNQVGEKLWKLEEQLTCPYCKHRFEQPRTLPCLHSFCLRCIEGLPQTIQEDSYLALSCPSCERLTPLPGGDQAPANFLPTFHIINLLGIHELLQKVALQTACDTCHRHPAASYCKQCTWFLCQDCVDYHKKWENLAEHELTEVKEVIADTAQYKDPPTVSCQAHSMPRDYYCKTCSKCLCRKCTFSNHQGHDCSLVTDVFPKHKQEIESALQVVREQLAGREEFESVRKFVEEELRLGSPQQVMVLKKLMVDRMKELSQAATSEGSQAVKD